MQPFKPIQVLTSEEYGQVLRRWKCDWQKASTQTSRADFKVYLHHVLGHRTLARAIIQFNITSQAILQRRLGQASCFIGDASTSNTVETGNEFAKLEALLRRNA